MHINKAKIFSKIIWCESGNNNNNNYYYTRRCLYYIINISNISLLNLLIYLTV